MQQTKTPAQIALSETPLPIGIEKEQIVNIKSIGNAGVAYDFAIYQRNSINKPLKTNGKNYTSSGILYKMQNTSQTNGYKKLIEFTDTEARQGKNNVYDMWLTEENGAYVMYVLLVDQNGAGRGEGVAKVLTIKLTSDKDNEILSTAKEEITVKHCFYYTQEEGDFYDFPQLEMHLALLEEQGRLYDVTDPDCNNFEINL